MIVNGIDTGTLETQANSALKPGGAAADKKKIAAHKVAQEFEALFVGMMLKSMRETVGKDMLAGKGQSEDIYRSMLDQEYAKSIAEQGGLGLAKTIEKQLLDATPHKAVAVAAEGEK